MIGFSVGVLIFFPLFPPTVIRRTHLSLEAPSFKTKNIIKNLLFSRVPARLFLFNIVSVRKINGFNYPLSHQRRRIQMSFLPSAKHKKNAGACRLCLNDHCHSFMIFDPKPFRFLYTKFKKKKILPIIVRTLVLDIV